MNEIILNTTSNNGYTCSCCIRSWDDTEIVEKDEMLPIEEIMDRALSCDPWSDFGCITDMIYEQNEEYLYGYSLSLGRKSFEVRIIVENKEYILRESEKESLLATIREDFKGHPVLEGFLWN